MLLAACKVALLINFLILTTKAAMAQDPQFDWVKQFGHQGFEKMGLVGSLDYNMFLLKYNESDELLWTQKAG
jgi:hypothetical protein